MKRTRLLIAALMAVGACGPPADRWKDWEGKRLFIRREQMDSLVDTEGMTVACVGKAAEMAIDADYPCLRGGRRYTRKQIDSLVNSEGMTKACVEQANRTGFNVDFACDKAY